MSTATLIQFGVFLSLSALVAVVTWLHCRRSPRSASDAKEYFLAGGTLGWVFIAGSLTLTNINTDTLVGWNGNQMLLIACWELAGIPGLILLAKVFVPLYYKYNCTTVTELLERRYRNKHIRATVATIFLLSSVLLFLPVMLYTSSLVLQTMFGLKVPLLVLAAGIAAAGAAYAIFGGLRAVAISDTYSGVIVLGMSLLVAVLAMNAVDWDLSGIPPERLTLLGGPDSVLPWPTLLTGMIFTQLYYWSTNQTITQRILAAPSIREAQKGAYGAAVIRLLIVPPMIALPGVCAYKLYGPLGDATYGHIVGQLLPPWLLGAFAAAMFAAVMTSYNSTLNSAAALYVCDLHQKYINPDGHVARLSVWLQVGFALLSIALVPLYQGADSIIQLIQQLLGLFSMPILAAFITGLLRRAGCDRDDRVRCGILCVAVVRLAGLAHAGARHGAGCTAFSPPDVRDPVDLRRFCAGAQPGGLRPPRGIRTRHAPSLARRGDGVAGVKTDENGLRGEEPLMDFANGRNLGSEAPADRLRLAFRGLLIADREGYSL